jgi:hypothetical protein
VVGALVSRSGREIRSMHRHGMTHSLYIQDPNARGVELVYELPRGVWEGDIDAALNFAEARSREERSNYSLIYAWMRRGLRSDATPNQSWSMIPSSHAADAISVLVGEN